MASSTVTEGRAEVSSARDRLSGALSFAADRLDREEFATHGVFGSPNKRLHSLDVELGSPTKSPRPARRRRKKEAPAASAFHHTFVMKLFDRSVDLAQFNKNTSLYPVCRAWMINDPTNTSMAPRQRTPTPEPASPSAEKAKNKEPSEKDQGDKEPGDKEPGDKEAAANGDKADEEASADKESEKKDGEDDDPIIYKMPTHLPLPVDDDGNHKSVRVPDLTPTKDVDEEFFEKAKKNYPNAPGREALLNDHMVKWFKVRRRWKEAAAKNEERYKPSMDLLKEMFEK